LNEQEQNWDLLLKFQDSIFCIYLVMG